MLLASGRAIMKDRNGLCTITCEWPPSTALSRATVYKEIVGISLVLKFQWDVWKKSLKKLTEWEGREEGMIMGGD